MQSLKNVIIDLTLATFSPYASAKYCGSSDTWREKIQFRQKFPTNTAITGVEVTIFRYGIFCTCVKKIKIKIDLVKFYEKLNILKNKSWSNNGGKHTDGYFYINNFFLHFWINKRKYDQKDLRRLTSTIVWRDSVLFTIVSELPSILGPISSKRDFSTADILGFDIGVS